MTTNNDEPIVKPRARTHEEYLMNTAQTAVVAIMSAILQAGDFERTCEECVTMARSLYTRTMRQIDQTGL